MDQKHNGCNTIGSPTSTTTLTTNCTSPTTKHESLKIELNNSICVEKPPPLPNCAPPETESSSSDEHEENDPSLISNPNLFSDQQPDLLKLILNDDLEHSIV